MRSAMQAGLAVFVVSACGPPESPPQGDFSGVSELVQPLSPLATAPTFVGGALAVAVASGELAIVSKHAVSGALLVNDVVTSGATALTVKTIAVTGGAGAQTVILDFANGTFAPGTATGAGITVTLGAGADVFKVRGAATTADTLTVGGTALAAQLAFNVDAYKDVQVNGTGTIAFTFSLGGGNDLFNALSGAYGTGGAPFAGGATVYGGGGDDTLTGGDGNDTLYGDVGNDLLNGGSSAFDSDLLYGGAGTDTVSYSSRTGDLFVSIGVTGAGDGEATETDDVMSDVEIVRGGSGNDVFYGWTGNETLYGGPGNDLFHMGVWGANGAGNDTIFGEAGIDTVSYAQRNEAVTITMDGDAANDGNPVGGELDNVRTDVENLVCPTAAVVCTVTGNALDNSLTGGGGDDVLTGGAGDDTLVMGADSGIGAGADQLSGGLGIDTVSFATFGAAITVTMNFVASVTMGKKLNTDVENVTCASASACNVTGNGLNNRIVGSSASDTIDAAGGDDFVETGGGNDLIECGDGSDIVLGAGTPVTTGCEL